MNETCMNMLDDKLFEDGYRWNKGHHCFDFEDIEEEYHCNSVLVTPNYT